MKCYLKGWEEVFPFSLSATLPFKMSEYEYAWDLHFPVFVCRGEGCGAKQGEAVKQTEKQTSKFPTKTTVDVCQGGQHLAAQARDHRTRI